MIRSLRNQLLIGTTLASVLTLGILAAALDQSMRRSVIRDFDSRLSTQAFALSTLVKEKRDDVRLDPRALTIPEFLPGDSEAYFELHAKGNVIGRSASLASRENLPAPGNDPIPPGESRIDTITLPGGVPARMVTIQFTPPREEEEERENKKRPPTVITLQVAKATTSLDAALTNQRWLIISLCGAATLLSAGVLLLLVNRTTRPVRQLAEQIGALSAAGLSTTLNPKGLPSELIPVVDRLNGLLSNLSDAFSRERAFTADVAHELRTPIAGMLATLEVCRTRPRDAAGYETAIDQSLQMLAQTQSLVENLLLLARAEGGQLTLRMAPGNLSTLVEQCFMLFEARIQQRHLTVHFTLPPNAPVTCDAGFMRLVINNLLDNALSYTNAAGRITIAITQTDNQTTLSISNTGSTLTPEDATHVFERFWRKEASRSETGLHAGLGLSLCRRLMTLQGGDIRVQTTGEEFQVHATLPPAPAETSTSAQSQLPHAA